MTDLAMSLAHTAALAVAAVVVFAPGWVLGSLDTST